MSFWNEKEAKRLFQKLPFYNTFIEKARVKHLKNIDLLHKIPFYDELNIKQKYQKHLKNMQEVISNWNNRLKRSFSSIRS